jgi:F420-dependent oxidoreductase-like protein
MRLRVFTEPQHGASYEQQLAIALEAERLGFDAFFRSDHYIAFDGGDGLPGPTDSWVTLGALARETATIRLGTLVSSATFRHPGPLAISVAQVDVMSRGRVELGLGAGWNDQEHAACGIPFPPTGERFDRLAEQLEIVTGMWSTPVGTSFSYAGRHHRVTDSPALPKPVQNPLPIIIGGWGTKRTPRLAARHAAEFNMPFPPLDYYGEAVKIVRGACEAEGRDPDSLRYSVAVVLCCGEDEAQLQRRADAIHQPLGVLRANAAAGSPAEVVERLQAFGEAGADTVYLQVLDLDDLDHIRLVAEQVMPQVT